MDPKGEGLQRVSAELIHLLPRAVKQQQLLKRWILEDVLSQFDTFFRELDALAASTQNEATSQLTRDKFPDFPETRGSRLQIVKVASFQTQRADRKKCDFRFEASDGEHCIGCIIPRDVMAALEESCSISLDDACYATIQVVRYKMGVQNRSAYFVIKELNVLGGGGSGRSGRNKPLLNERSIQEKLESFISRRDAFLQMISPLKSTDTPMVVETLKPSIADNPGINVVVPVLTPSSYRHKEWRDFYLDPLEAVIPPHQRLPNPTLHHSTGPARNSNQSLHSDIEPTDTNVSFTNLVSKRCGTDTPKEAQATEPECNSELLTCRNDENGDTPEDPHDTALGFTFASPDDDAVSESGGAAATPESPMFLTQAPELGFESESEENPHTQSCQFSTESETILQAIICDPNEFSGQNTSPHLSRSLILAGKTDEPSTEAFLSAVEVENTMEMAFPLSRSDSCVSPTPHILLEDQTLASAECQNDVPSSSLQVESAPNMVSQEFANSQTLAHDEQDDVPSFSSQVDSAKYIISEALAGTPYTSPVPAVERTTGPGEDLSDSHGLQKLCSPSGAVLSQSPNTKARLSNSQTKLRLESCSSPALSPTFSSQNLESTSNKPSGEIPASTMIPKKGIVEADQQVEKGLCSGEPYRSEHEVIDATQFCEGDASLNATITSSSAVELLDSAHYSPRLEALQDRSPDEFESILSTQYPRLDIEPSRQSVRKRTFDNSRPRDAKRPRLADGVETHTDYSDHSQTISSERKPIRTLPAEDQRFMFGGTVILNADFDPTAAPTPTPISICRTLLNTLSDRIRRLDN